MSDKSNFSAELLRLCGAMRDHAITDAQALRLSELLVEHPQSRRFFLRFMAVTSCLESRVSLEETDATNQNSESQAGLLVDLLQLEAAAEIELRVFSPATPSKRRSGLQRQNELGWREITGAAGYLLIQTARSNTLRWLAAAAVLLLAATLFFSLAGYNAKPQLASQQLPSDHVSPQTTQPAFATLTGVVDGQWQVEFGQVAPIAGDLLAPGRRLTLTAGFAEITTSRGAIAILEAPANIELMDRDNAIYLHDGKLLGICKTPTSKGFAVRTAHAEIVDLGTRFVVDTDQVQTQAGVIEGEVSVAAVDPISGMVHRHDPLVLGTGEGAAARAGAGRIDRQPVDTGAFVRSIEDASLLPRWSGPVRFLHELPGDRDLAKITSTEHLFMYAEQHGVRLKAGLDVGLVQPGRYAGDLLISPRTRLAQDQLVDSYLILHNRHSGTVERPKPAGDELTLTLHFDRPIVGVLVTTEQMLATDDLVGVEGVQYGEPTSRTVMEDDGLNRPDFIEISPDRRSVTLSLFALKTDNVRVLLESSPAEGEGGGT